MTKEQVDIVWMAIEAAWRRDEKGLIEYVGRLIASWQPEQHQAFRNSFAKSKPEIRA